MSSEAERARHRILVALVEPRRVELGMSLREAARRAGMSDANWRQLVVGRTPNKMSPRRPSKRQLLLMAGAVGLLDRVAVSLGASDQEVNDVRTELAQVPSPAEVELLAARHLTAAEKVELLAVLRQLRCVDLPREVSNETRMA